MENANLPNFVVLDSVYGKFIVNRYCFYQAEALIKTGKTHIEHELEKIFRLLERLPEESVIIDGGTNIGFFTIPVASKTRHRGFKLIGFEPQRQIYYALAGSLALNDFDHCHLYNLGLSDRSGAAGLPAVDYSKNADFGLVAIAQKEGGAAKDYLDDKTVPTVAIDEMNLPRVDFIKLDVEGHELQAIKGAMETIRKYRPLLWVEYFLVGFDNVKACFDGVEGYAHFVMDKQNMLCAPSEKLAAMGVEITY